jgi:hypothetical protein
MKIGTPCNGEERTSDEKSKLGFFCPYRALYGRFFDIFSGNGFDIAQRK